ncbi:MAG: DUF2207 domain-containing protein [Leptolyngbyaceae cyanobacterium]
MISFFRKVPGISKYLIISFCACLLSLSPALAQTDAPFYWDFINVDVTLESNGDLLVTETQKYTFTDEHTNQRYRYIPLKRLDQIMDVAVYEGEESLPVQTGIENGQYWIRWQHDLNPPESHEFVIEYRVVGGVQAMGDTSRLYWRALFPERNAAIKQSQVTVRLPEALSDEVTSIEGQGAGFGDRQIDPTTFEFTIDEPLLPQAFFDIEVSFPRDILNLEVPEWQSNLSSDDQSPQPLGNSSQGQGTTHSTFRSKLIEYVLALGILGTPIGILFLASAIQRRCPQCGKFTLRRMSRILQHATAKHEGKREIEHACDRCDYHKTFTLVIPPTSPQSKCPQCSEITLCHLSRVLRRATERQEGLREIEHTCRNCSYRRVSTKVIPVVVMTDTPDRNSGRDRDRRDSCSGSDFGGGSDDSGASGGGGGG